MMHSERNEGDLAPPSCPIARKGSNLCSHCSRLSFTLKEPPPGWDTKLERGVAVNHLQLHGRLSLYLSP